MNKKSTDILKQKVSGIYKITSPTNKIYIGKSIDIYSRWQSYKSLNCKQQTRLYHSLKKYGYNKHRFEIVKLCAENELNFYENHFIQHFKCLSENGLNCFYGGKYNVALIVNRGKIERKRKYNREYNRRKREESKKITDRDLVLMRSAVDKLFPQCFFDDLCKEINLESVPF